jgi:hypothetical protein
MKEDWVPIKIPDNLDKMLNDMINSDEPRVGWCLLCNQPIRSEADFLENSHTHNCQAGRELEMKIASETSRTRRRPRCRSAL